MSGPRDGDKDEKDVAEGGRGVKEGQPLRGRKRLCIAGLPAALVSKDVHPALEDGRLEGRRVAWGLADRCTDTSIWVSARRTTEPKERQAAPACICGVERRRGTPSPPPSFDAKSRPLAVPDPKGDLKSSGQPREYSRREGVMSDWRPVATRPTTPCLGGPAESVVSARWTAGVASGSFDSSWPVERRVGLLGRPLTVDMMGLLSREARKGKVGDAGRCSAQAD